MNKLLLQISDLGWPKVILASLLISAAYFFGLRDDGSVTKAGIENAKGQLTEAQSQLQVTKKAVDNAERFEKEVKSAKKQFERVTEFMPPKISIADLTTLISEKAAKSSVRLLSTSPKGPAGGAAERSTLFETIRVTFKIEGSFAQIVGFLSQISRDTRMLTFDETDLTTVAGTEADMPTLNFSGDLVGYRYLKPTAPAVAPMPANGQAPAAPAQPPPGGANAK